MTNIDDRIAVDLRGEQITIGRQPDGSVKVEVINGRGEPLAGAVLPPLADSGQPQAHTTGPQTISGTTSADATPAVTVSGRRAVGRSTRKLRPGLWTPADVGLVLGSAATAALVVAVVLRQFFESPGWLADLSLWFVLTLGLVYFTAREQMGPLAARDRVATLVIGSGALLLVVPLVSLLGYIFIKGLPSLRLSFFTHDLKGVAPGSPATEGGGLHAIVGTLEQAGIALLIVLPLGVLTAVFLNETRSKFRRPVRIIVDAMSGLPSIVAGLFIYSALIINKPGNSPLFNFNGFMAALALSMVMLPTVTRTVDVVLRLVPDGLREASLALGASRARTVWSIVLPTARSGVTTAIVLGLARIVGETAPLLFTSFGNTLLNGNPFKDPQESLPFFVYRLVKLPSATDSERGYIGAVVLILIVLSLFTIARWAGRPRKAKTRSPRPATDLLTSATGRSS
jgi:phosphate transport system permease protein